MRLLDKFYVHRGMCYLCKGAHMHTDTDTHIHAHTYMHTHTHTRTHMHTHALICTHTHSYAHTRTHMHTHALICTHTHSYAHTRTHTHTHTSPKEFIYLTITDHISHVVGISVICYPSLFCCFIMLNCSKM